MYKYSNQKHVNDSMFFLIEEKVRFIIFFSLQILFSTRLPVVKQIFMRIDLCAKDNVKTLITFDRGSFIQSGTYFIGFGLFDARLECEITTDWPRRLLACYSATRVSQTAPVKSPTPGLHGTCHCDLIRTLLSRGSNLTIVLFNDSGDDY